MSSNKSFRSIQKYKMRGSCVTNASPSGLRSCMEDEGRPFEVGFREQASNHPKRHRSKAVVVSVGGKGRRYRSGVDHGDERERTPDDVSKHFLATSKPGAGPSPGTRLGVPDDGPTGVRHGGGVTVILASI